MPRRWQACALLLALQLGTTSARRILPKHDGDGPFSVDAAVDAAADDDRDGAAGGGVSDDNADAAPEYEGEEYVEEEYVEEQEAAGAEGGAGRRRLLTSISDLFGGGGHKHGADDGGGDSGGGGFGVPSGPSRHLVKDLPGLSSAAFKTRQWAGLLPVDDDSAGGAGALFYWLFECDSDACRKVLHAFF